MPMHSDRRRHGRGRRRRSELDWFAEDPWADPDVAALEGDDEEEWYPGLWEPGDDDSVWAAEDSADAWSEDPYDGWGPVRPRRGRPSGGP